MFTLVHVDTSLSLKCQPISCLDSSHEPVVSTAMPTLLMPRRLGLCSRSAGIGPRAPFMPRVGHDKWTPILGPRNAEIKLAFQGLLGLGFCCFNSLRSHSSNASEPSASSLKGAPRR